VGNTSSSMKMMRSPVARAMPALRPRASPAFGCSSRGRFDHARRLVARAVVHEHDLV